MLTFTLLAHVLACVWYVIGEAEQPAYDKEEDFQWPGTSYNDVSDTFITLLTFKMIRNRMIINQMYPMQSNLV